MAVYVDKARNPFGRMMMCHMVADTLEELHDMAQKLGLKRSWFQHRSSIPHYDICQSKRRIAILEHGAVEIDRKKLVELIQAYRR